MYPFLFINRLKVLLKNKALIFWSLFFPLVLGTLFSLAFSNLFSSILFDPFEIAVVSDDNYNKEGNLKYIIEYLSSDSDDKIFITTYVAHENEALELLLNNKIVGYIIVSEKIEIASTTNSIETTIMKSVVDEYYQTYSLIANITEYNPSIIANDIMEAINEDVNYFTDISNKNVDFTIIYFYTLIGMMCLYGGFFGMDAVCETEANLSKRAARMSVSPRKKLAVLLTFLLCGLLIHYLEILILLGYLVIVLGVNFGNQLGYILLLSLCGSLAGITMGIFIGSSTKKSQMIKTAIIVSVSMVCSFLSGMMVWTMKYIINQHIPFLNMINPVALITDGLYALYYYETFTRYFTNVIGLLIFSVVMVALSYLFIRRKKYGSI